MNAQILNMVVVLTMKAKIATLFTNAKEACHLRVNLEEIGHFQTPTPIKVNNATAVAFGKNLMTFKQTKSIDICFLDTRQK